MAPAGLGCAVFAHQTIHPSVRPSVHPSCCILYRQLHHEFAIEEPKEIGTDGQTVDADDDDVHFTCAKFSRRSELQTVEKRALVVPLSLTATTPRYSCCQNEFLFLKCDGCRFIRTKVCHLLMASPGLFSPKTIEVKIRPSAGK